MESNHTSQSKIQDQSVSEGMLLFPEDEIG